MAIDPTATRNEDGSWSFAWSGGSTPWAIWLNGKQIDSVATAAYTFGADPDYETSPPPLEIVGTGDTAESSLYPPRAVIQWRGVLTAAEYGVEQYVGGAWVEVANVSETAAGYYTYESDALTDETTHQFRVKAYRADGVSGAAITFSLFCARNPAPPSGLSYTITSSGDVSVS